MWAMQNTTESNVQCTGPYKRPPTKPTTSASCRVASMSARGLVLLDSGCVHPLGCMPRAKNAIMALATNTKTKIRKARPVCPLGPHGFKIALIHMFLVVSWSMTTCNAASDYALMTLNGVQWQAHKSGVAVHVPDDRISVVRVCTIGDVRARCFGGADELNGFQMASHVSGCEVVSADCTCYRWMYSRELTNTPSQVRVAVSRKRPSCAIITFTPPSTGSGTKTERITTVNLRFALDHFRPVLPMGYLYHLRADYNRAVRQLKYKRPFFQYVHTHKEAFCNQRITQDQAQLAPITYGCRREHVVALYATNIKEARKGTDSFVEATIWSIHIFILFGILYYRNKKQKTK